jgi:hypothetical protein
MRKLVRWERHFRHILNYWVPINPGIIGCYTVKIINFIINVKVRIIFDYTAVRDYHRLSITLVSFIIVRLLG